VQLDAENLFARYFLPLYPPEMRGSLGVVRTADANPAGNPHILAQLDTLAETFAKLAPAALDAPDLDLDFSDDSVHRLATAITRSARDKLITPVEQAGELPLLVEFVTHGAVYVGSCAVRAHGGVWAVRNPLWESLVQLESRAGKAQLAVFQWWLKALSDDEIDEPLLADRYRMHVEMPTMEPEKLPIMAPPDRKLPRLTKVRYDSLHKYLRAHLPELRSVGDHFPSPERLDEMGFHWLDFTMIGQGRMLLMHGPTDDGVHLLWLDMTGFISSAYYPADALPEHELRLDEDKLQLVVPILGKLQTHEMLWWGP
jgi:hypothetical protein